MRRAALLAGLLAFVACRTTRPPAGTPLAPLNASSPAQAAAELAQRRAEFRGEQALVRIRIPNSTSARAALQVDPDMRLSLTVFTPIGTTAARLTAAHDEVTFIDEVHHTRWEGKAADFAGSYGIFGSTLPTEAIAALLIGLPPPGLDAITYAATGMKEARFADVIVSYDPPVYPPKRVIVDRADRHVEIEYLGGQVSNPR